MNEKWYHVARLETALNDLLNAVLYLKNSEIKSRKELKILIKDVSNKVLILKNLSDLCTEEFYTENDRRIKGIKESGFLKKIWDVEND